MIVYIMRELGSLSQFIDPVAGPVNEQKQMYYRQLTKAQLQYNKQNSSRRRVRTNIDEYVASNKKLLIKSFKVEKQEQDQTDYIKKLNQMYKPHKYRTPMNSIVLPKRSQILEIKQKSRLKMEEGLLRAVQKIKVNEEKEKGIPQKSHETSFLTYSQTISRLKLLPIQSMRQHQSGIDSLKTPKFIIREKRSKTSLSDTKRVQFQKCLSWAKKHKKDDNYYKKQLGKVIYKFDWNGQVQKRKRLLSILSEKYSMGRQHSPEKV